MCRESLERLQLERDNLVEQAKESQKQAIQNEKLQAEVQEMHTHLLVTRSEAAEAPAGDEEEWKRLRSELQDHLHNMRQRVARESTTPGAAETAVARLVEVEAALQDSQRQTAGLSKKCNDMQEEIDVLQRQRAAALQAAAAANARLEEEEADSAKPPPVEDSDGTPAVDAPAGAVEVPEGSAGDGWGCDARDWDEWGEDEKPAEGSTHGSCSTSMRPVDLDAQNRGDSPSRQGSSDQARAVQNAMQTPPQPQSCCATLPSSMSTVARSPFPATPSSVGAGDGKCVVDVQQEEPDSPAALSFNPLFDASAVTPDPPGRLAHPDTEAKSSAWPSVAGTLLATPLVQWDTLQPQQLETHLCVLQSVSAALAHLRSQNGSALANGSLAQTPADPEPQSHQALGEVIRTVEQRLAGQIAEIGVRLGATSSPQKLSGLGSETLLRLPSQPTTPRSPGGSPAASTSIFGLHSTLQELLRAHQGLLQACNGGDEAAQRCHTETKRLAAEVEAELQRLHELHVQQETEVSIQWHEKQQAQSTAQVQLSAKEQVWQSLPCCLPVSIAVPGHKHQLCRQPHLWYDIVVSIHCESIGTVLSLTHFLMSVNIC